MAVLMISSFCSTNFFFVSCGSVPLSLNRRKRPINVYMHFVGFTLPTSITCLCACVGFMLIQVEWSRRNGAEARKQYSFCIDFILFRLSARAFIVETERFTWFRGYIFVRRIPCKNLPHHKKHVTTMNMKKIIRKLKFVYFLGGLFKKQVNSDKQ